MDMETSLAILYLFGGSVYLVVGGDLLVRGAVALSRQMGISTMAVSLTVVAFGTSAPELVVSVGAALGGYPELAISNVVGSNIANVLLVVGLPAMIYPMACDQQGAGRDATFMLGVSVLFAGLCWGGSLGRPEGLVLLGALAVFIIYVVRLSGLGEAWKATPRELPLVLGLPSKPWMIATFIVVGAVGLPLGAGLLIDGAVTVAEALGVSNSVIGLTLVALSTSLPELATTVVAALKREADVAVGNVVGSNVLNIVAIMGIAAVVSPGGIPVPDPFLRLDLPLMLVAAGVLTVVALRRGRVIRSLGAGLMAGYVLYVLLLFRTP